MRRFLLILGFLFFALPAFGTTTYIAASAGTFIGGSACNGQTAVTPTTFNALTPSPGDVIWFCGTIIGTTNTNLIVVNASGTGGNPITFNWDSGAILEEAYCPAPGAGGCIQVGGHNYITLNGGTNGIIQNTANGTGLANQQASTAIENDGGTNFIQENLTIANIYVHTSASDSSIADSAANCVYNNGVASGWVIKNNTMHDMSWCINIQYNTSSNITISGNTIYNIDHGIALGGPNAGYTLSNVNISGNNIHDYSKWDTTMNSYHHDGVHVWGYMDNGSDTIFNLNIYNNTFGGCIGQNVTAHVFIEANAGGSDAVNIYNNTFIDTCSGNDTNGMLTTGVDGGHNIYNNTFIGASTDVCVGTSSSPSITFINNVVSGCGTLMYIATGGGFAASGLHNNIYANCSGGNCWNWKGSTTGTFSTWQSDTGQDASPSAYTASAGLNASGVPQAGSAVISQGANLTSLGIIALNSDILGMARPSSGAWDVGAYKYASLLPPTISPLFPVLTPGGATQTFTVTANPGTGGAWACANASNGGTCLGSINSSTGVYTPPATLVAPQSLGGYPLLPWDHVFNTKIASLPACDGITHCSQSSATFISGAGTVPFNYLPDFPINYVNASTPTDTMTFYYTPGNNGTYQSPQWPVANIQNGWFGAITSENDVDHHFFTIDTTNGNLSERYQYYAHAPVTSCSVISNQALCFITPTNTSFGFIRKAQAGGINSNFEIGSFTGADTYLNGTWQLTAATSTTITFAITHANASTSSTGQATAAYNGVIACAIAGTCTSQSGFKYAYTTYALPSISTNAAGTAIMPLLLRGQEIDSACANSGSINHALAMTLQNGYMHPAFIWPATTSANAGSGVNFYGQRIRLKASFNISTFSPCAQVLLMQLKNYGVFLADGGGGWQVGVEWGDTSPTAASAMREILGASIAPSNFEMIDESSLEESSTSGATTSGEVVTYTASTGSASTNVALMGTAADVPNSQSYISAGTVQYQLVDYSNGAVTWTSPQSAGTIQGQNLAGNVVTASGNSIATAGTAPTSLTGDFVDLTISQLSTTIPSTVTDFCGNSYTHNATADFTVPGGGATTTRWYGFGITGCASNVWTAAYPSNVTYRSINVREYNPNGATVTLDVVPTPVTSSATGQTSITSNAFTTTGTNEVVVPAIGILQSNPITAGNIAGQPAANLLQPVVGGFNAPATEDALFTSTQTGITAGATFGAVNGAGISVMTYKGAGGTSIRGTLTSGGLYTAPATLARPVTATIIVTSTVNSALSRQMLIHIFPLNDIRLTQGTANYTDSHGNLWTAGYGIGASNAPSYQGCCQNNASFPAITDKQLFWNHYSSSQTTGDFKMDVHVPVGTYNATYNLGTVAAGGVDAQWFYVQGISQGSFDPGGLVGIHEPYTYTQTGIGASSGVLSFYLSGIGAQTSNTADISSFGLTQVNEIIPTAPVLKGLLVQ